MVNERWNGLLLCQYHANQHVCALLSIRSGSGRAFWSRSWLTVNRSFSFCPIWDSISRISPSFYPSLSSVSTHFSKYRATALGIASAGSSFGLPFFTCLWYQVKFFWNGRWCCIPNNAGTTFPPSWVRLGSTHIWLRQRGRMRSGYDPNQQPFAVKGNSLS